MKVLVIEPLEPLVLSGTPIMGVHYFSYTKVCPIPLPTTVIGALGAALGVRIANAKDSIDALVKLVEQLLEKCRCNTPILAGPLVKFRELPWLYIPVEDIFIPISAPAGRVGVLQVSGDGAYIDLEACKYTFCVNLAHEIRTGITLERRSTQTGDKKVKLGYMYRYGVTEYRTFDGRPLTPLFIYKFNCEDIEPRDIIIRVGGEQRIAKISVLDIEKFDKEQREILEKVKTPLNLDETGIYIALNYVPVIPNDYATLELDLSKIIGLEFVSSTEDIIGVVPPKGKTPTIRIERLGLGFSEVVRARRPQILVLPPGTLFRISHIKKLERISRIVRTLWNIGFTSLLKLK